MGDAVQLRAHAPESVDKRPLLMRVNAMNKKIARGAVTKATRSASVPPSTVVKKVVACATPAGRLLRREDGMAAVPGPGEKASSSPVGWCHQAQMI